MNEDLDAWLNADVANDVAKATGASPAPVVNPQGKGLGKFGITRGGVIRNPNTKKVTMTSNPVATPKTTKIGMTKAVNAPTPEEDFKAEHPALAIPTVMTGMDMDTQKRNGAVVSSQPAPAPVAPGQPVPVTYQSTLKELLNLAVASGGILHFGTGEFVLSIQILKAQG
jgi:hypothetical protein